MFECALLFLDLVTDEEQDSLYLSVDRLNLKTI